MKAPQPSARDLQIYELACEGRSSQAVIASQFRVTQQRVSQVCLRVDEWFAAQLADRVQALKARHTQRLEMIWQAAMAAYYRSQEPLESAADAGEAKVGSSRARGPAGNPAFLAQARGALDDIRRIWGANEPEVRVEGGGIPTAGKTREQLVGEFQARFDSLMQRLQSSQENR